MKFDFEKAAQQLRRFGVDISREGLEAWLQDRGIQTVESFVDGVSRLPWGKHVAPEKAVAVMYRYEAHNLRQDEPLDKKNRNLGKFLSRIAVLDPYSAAVIGMNADGIGEERISPEEIRLQKLCEYSSEVYTSQSTKALRYLQDGLRQDLFELLREQGLDPRREDNLLKECLVTRPYSKEHPWMGLTSSFGIDIISVLAVDGHRVVHPIKYDVLTEGKDEYGISEARAYELALLWSMLQGKADVADGIVCRRIAVPTSKCFMQMIPLQVDEPDLKRLGESMVRACDIFWTENLIGNIPVASRDVVVPPPFTDAQLKRFNELALTAGRAVALAEEVKDAEEIAKKQLRTYVEELIETSSLPGIKFPSEMGMTVYSRKTLHMEAVNRLLETVPEMSDAVLVPTPDLDPAKIQAFLEDPDVRQLMAQKGLADDAFSARELDKNRLLRFVTDHPDLGINPNSLYEVSALVSRSKSRAGMEALGRIRDDIQGQRLVETYVFQPEDTVTMALTPHNFF